MFKMGSWHRSNCEESFWGTQAYFCLSGCSSKMAFFRDFMLPTGLFSSSEKKSRLHTSESETILAAIP